MSFIDTRVKIRRFFRRHKKIIIFAVIAFTIIVVINYVLKNLPEQDIPKTTYEPNVAVMDNSEVPTKWQDQIKDTIDQFVQYCNNKDYDSAYNMITDECKEALFQEMSEFKEYVDSRFNTKKIYSIQNFSNVGKQYIYNVNIMDDFMATGMTNSNYVFVEEKFVFTEDGNNLKFSIGGFIRQDNLGVFAEDENLKVQIDTKNVYYEREVYHVRIRNKTEHPLVIADGYFTNEITLNLGTQDRTEYNVSTSKVVLQPGETKVYNFIFTKYCDDGVAPKYLRFNDVRVLESYSGNKDTADEELENAIRKYALQINFNVQD